MALFPSEMPGHCGHKRVARRRRTPTPVCTLLSGVMVELGVFGVWRVYGDVFAGPGGIPAADLQRVLLVLGVLTGVLGAVMRWYQRHF
ncbi:hypothetical protein GCM10010307_87270 [Streptomyces vastus]|uniref:NADH:quinone oxidoreductase/Mrp antiporter transmembrane domain-containing protein n=1 Tax=Streptomyces vastus TaxID=285451 RepID=A0ABN3S0S3_9ACTN